MSARLSPRAVALLTHGVVLLVLVLVLAGLFGPVLWHPGRYLFSSAEDGLKNYYTSLWYVRHDAGLWFTGMSYPFGEHVVFTDNQPLLSFVLAALQRRGVAVNTVAVFNSCMLGAQLLSAPPLLALLRRCRLPAWYAGTVTVLIVLLAPQMERLLGHYALSYSCVIPILWYVVVRATEARRRWGWYGTYAAVTLFFGCLHPYYFPVSALLLLAHSAVEWWQTSGKALWPQRITYWLPVLLTLAVPVVLFQVTLALTDPYAAGRPSNPYGFFAYSSSIWSVFFPVEQPVLGWWQSIFHTPDPSWEGQAYVGLAGTVVVIGTLVRVGWHLRRRHWQRLRRPALPPVLRISLWAGFLILLFAMGWPFRWGLEGLLPFLGPLRQFRSIGRFAWIFYYFYSAYGAYALYQAFRWLRQHHHALPGAIMLTTALLLWAAESVFSTGHKAFQIRHPHYPTRVLTTAPGQQPVYQRRLAIAGRRVADFQAILPIPYYALGSEVFATFNSDKSSYESMRASLETGLPIAATMLSRTPLHEAQALIQVLSNPAIDKTLLTYLPDQRPLLLVVSATAPRDSAEASLLARAQVFYRDSAVWLAALPLNRLEARAPLVAEFRQRQAALRAYPGYWSSADSPQVVHRSFDTAKPVGKFSVTAAPLLGMGAQVVRKGLFLLADQPLTQAGSYEASVWAYVRTDDLPSLHWRLTDAQGVAGDSSVVETKFGIDVLGDWVRLTAHIHSRRPGQQLRIWMKGRKYVFDEFELRPESAAIWRYDSLHTTLIHNNYPLMPAPRRSSHH
ncbi:hypothetical protein [Hymenobacter negativus]|uniref:DUF6311 domain-containing protein n=1 Tax=Hymenobacter negativus TaxID=2795026 RepID=A0ABS3QC81_9BACT|nr:hypothetical protein [Hymenobacter negativus]MBO2008320.1 hypothetical protein [Hymenobacter negativus]